MVGNIRIVVMFSVRLPTVQGFMVYSLDGLCTCIPVFLFPQLVRWQWDNEHIAVDFRLPLNRLLSPEVLNTMACGHPGNCSIG